MYHYDLFGWLTDAEIAGRGTDVPPPEETDGLRANWNGEQWVLMEYVAPPPLPVPPPASAKSVTRRQGRLALLSYGMLDDVEAAIEAIADPIQRQAAQIEYEASVWERDNPFLEGMWEQLGGTPEALNELFDMASTL